MKGKTERVKSYMRRKREKKEKSTIGKFLDNKALKESLK
jgi:hypothetical protein